MNDGMAVARTGAACMMEVPPRDDGSGRGGTGRKTRVTDWCYQGVTDRSNTNEALMRRASSVTPS
ncbi:hypothetical protein GCM10010317_008930 [Streptomyces mirabilis]|nr:hypothetical protein GCM10010317_008930 [Streptomyces mirabilis]